MIEFIFGDALKNDCDVLCHQVNLDGVMGGGVAFQIAYKYPEVEVEYMQYQPKSMGEVCFSSKPTVDGFIVANCFSQDDSYSTNYNALKTCLNAVRDYMNKHNLSSVAFPYNYGCGIARGDWSHVLSVIASVFNSGPSNERKYVKIYRLSN